MNKRDVINEAVPAAGAMALSMGTLTTIIAISPLSGAAAITSGLALLGGGMVLGVGVTVGIFYVAYRVLKKGFKELRKYRIIKL